MTHGRATLRQLRKTALLVMVLTTGGRPAQAQSAVDLKPTPQQTEWQDLEFGVILHFDTNTFLDREWGDGTADPKVFNPTAFDPNQWMRAIKASGAKYVVLVAKHHDGFCLWPTSQTDYSIKQSPWKSGKGDVVREVSTAARENGLKFGIYLSPWDRHEPKYKDPSAYDKYYNAELQELASSYGDLVELWLDGAGSTGRTYDFSTIISTLRTYQPNTIVFADTGLFEYGDARWAGNESGKIEYQNWNVVDRLGYRRWRPAEADTPLRKLHWFWHPNDEGSLKTVDELLDSYENVVGHGGQWMLGVAPDNRGLLTDGDAARLRELGDTIRARYSRNLLLDHTQVDANVANALDSDLDTFWSAPDHSHVATLEVRLQKPITFDRAQTMEWLIEGQQIQRYSIDAWENGRWTPVVVSSAIGHRKIDSFAPVTATRVRLNILASTGEARIREFSVYSVGDSAPKPR
ncbi:alpha-L-fucosidase [Granulicella sibirica]|nr:alpha-L-fucosidase [Granulicella sibirica]